MAAEPASAPASAPASTEPETETPLIDQRTGGQASTPGGKTKDLVVKLHGQDRNLGSFPAKLHTDLRHVVEMLRRRKRPRFSGERLSLLEEAIASSPYRSLEELRQQIEAWREEDRAGFDANRYYDSDRTLGYTEHNRGSQDTLTRRSLQLSSVPTEGPTQDSILAVDLGCGSGLSSVSALNACAERLGVIGLDLSSEMLRAEEWKEAHPRHPLAGERLRADLAQPLPFRDHVFDLCYSVSAVHYLAADSLTQTAQQRIGQLTASVKRILKAKGRPCTLQAYMTRESNAVETFRQVALRDGWDLCELVVDQSHGRAERDYLYLSNCAAVPTSRPPRCALYRHCGATCALALETWAKGDAWPVRLDGAHRAWLVREHDRYARRILRLQKRCDDGAPLDHSSPGAVEQILADRLRKASECAEDEEARLSMILNVLHSPS